MAIEDTLRWAQSAVIVVLIVRLAVLKLVRSWPWFTSYLAANLIRSAIFAAIPPKTNTYAEAWMITEAVMMALWIAIALEMHLRVRDSYPGIGRFAWWLLITALTAGCVLTAATAFDYPSGRRILPTLFFARRALASVLAIELVGVASFFLFFQFAHRLAKNVVRHEFMLAIYFALQAAIYVGVLIAARPDGSAPGWSSYVPTAAAIGCYLAWNLVFRAAGEAQPPVVDAGPLEHVEDRADELVRAMRRARGTADDE